MLKLDVEMARRYVGPRKTAADNCKKRDDKRVLCACVGQTLLFLTGKTYRSG